MRSPEGWEKAAVDNYLKSIGAYYVSPTTGGYGASGHSDRIVCIKGRFWVLEVKREGKEPTALQWARMREAQAAGGMAAWGTAEKIIREIEEWRRTLSK